MRTLPNVRLVKRIHAMVVGVFAAAPLAACGSLVAQRQDMLIPACEWPAGANTFDAGSGSGCTPSSMFQICEVPSGSVLHADGTITTPSGETVTCSDACAPTEYSLKCVGSGPPASSIPAPDPALGCTSVGIPTPSNVLFYCCPCR